MSVILSLLVVLAKWTRFILIVKSIAMLDSARDGGRKMYGRSLHFEVEKLLCIHGRMATVSRWRNRCGAANCNISDPVLVVDIF